MGLLERGVGLLERGVGLLERGVDLLEKESYSTCSPVFCLLSWK